MYGKMQVPGLIEIIPLICTLTIWGHYTVFLQFPSVHTFGVTVVADGFVATTSFVYCCSVAHLCLTLWPHGLQHASLPCPSLSPGVCSNLRLSQGCPLSQWCHPTISSSVTLFSSCPQPIPEKHQGLFPWVGSSHQVAKVLELQHQSFQWIFRTDFL